MRDSQSQLREHQSRVRELEVKVSQMGESQNELKVQNSRFHDLQLENKNLIKEKDGLLREYVQLKERLGIAESKINGSKSGSGSGDGHPRVVENLWKRIEKLKETIDSLELELNEFKNNKEKPLVGGLKNRTLALWGGGLILAVGALGAIFNYDTHEQLVGIRNVTADKDNEIKELNVTLTEVRDKNKELEKEIPTKVAELQNKMEACNAKAKELRGDKLEKVMSDCLKAK